MNAAIKEPIEGLEGTFPPQGQWSLNEYLRFDEGRLIEYECGFVEIHEYPLVVHQQVLANLAFKLCNFVESHSLGRVLFAPLPVRLWEEKFREPDIVFKLAKHLKHKDARFWDGADLVMEVISPDDRWRNLRTKRREYAMAGIPEYWIVDPENEQIIVLTLDGEQYLEHGVFGVGAQAMSVLLSGFGVATSEVFAER